jgi:hypothetical protein
MRMGPRPLWLCGNVVLCGNVLRENPPDEKIEMRRLAKKAGVVGGERVDQFDQRLTGPVPLDMLVIIAELVEPEMPHYFPQPRGDQLFLAVAEFEAEFLARQRGDGGEFGRRERQQRCGGVELRFPGGPIPRRSR